MVALSLLLRILGNASNITTLNLTTWLINNRVVNLKGARSTQSMEVFKLITEVGFPIVGAIAAGYFVFLTMKFILAGVMGSINGLTGIIKALDNRVKTMNHEVIRIDMLMSSALGVKPDLDRIARADGKHDARRD